MTADEGNRFIELIKCPDQSPHFRKELSLNVSHSLLWFNTLSLSSNLGCHGFLYVVYPMSEARAFCQ